MEVSGYGFVRGKLAVVTGGGSGMGSELVGQLAAQGCAVATCDVHARGRRSRPRRWPARVRRTAPRHQPRCDVADEAQVPRFRDEPLAAHGTDHVDVVFSNAGIGGGGSFINDPREMWERVFAVDFWGVYHCARVFLPLLMKSPEGVLVNTSSVNGFWASLGAGVPHTAYSSAKFAVKGFSEALIEDLRINAPHVRVVLVMPGHVATNIVLNSMLANDMLPESDDMTERQLDARNGSSESACCPRASAWRPAPLPDPDGHRLPGQGAAQRGRRGDHHPRRRALRRLADPGRPGRCCCLTRMCAPIRRTPTTTRSCSPAMPQAAGEEKS